MAVLVVQDHLEHGRFSESQAGACGDLLECQLESLWSLATWPRCFLETIKEKWKKVRGSTPTAARRGTIHHWHVLLLVRILQQLVVKCSQAATSAAKTTAEKHKHSCVFLPRSGVTCTLCTTPAAFKSPLQDVYVYTALLHYLLPATVCKN